MMRSTLTLVALLLISCGREQGGVAGQSAKLDEIIATTRSQDDVSITFLARVLSGHGIRYAAGGSLVLSVQVSKSDVARANEALRPYKDTLSEYVLFPPSVEFPPLKPAEAVAHVDLAYADALARYPQEQVEGRLLRASNVAAVVRASGDAKIKDIRWHRRPFVTKDLQPTQAIDGEVDLVIVHGVSGEMKTVVTSALPE